MTFGVYRRKEQLLDVKQDIYTNEGSFGNRENLISLGLMDRLFRCLTSFQRRSSDGGQVMNNPMMAISASEETGMLEGLRVQCNTFSCIWVERAQLSRIKWLYSSSL